MWAGFSFYTGDHTTAYWMLFWATINVAIWISISIVITARKNVFDLKVRIISLEAKVDYLNAAERYRNMVDFEKAVEKQSLQNKLFDDITMEELVKREEKQKKDRIPEKWSFGEVCYGQRDTKGEDKI